MKKSSVASGARAKARAASARSKRIDAALEKLSKFTKAVDVGASAAGALIAYKYLVPEQLPFLGGGAFLIAGLGVVASWLGQSWLRRHSGKIVLMAAVCLLALLSLNVWAVQEVQYERLPAAHLLIGTQLTSYGDSTAMRIGSSSPSDIIREAGKDQIPLLWGDYHLFAFLYVLCFMLVSFFGAMALAAVVERVATRTR